MCRVLPPVVLLCVAIAGCGKRGGEAPTPAVETRCRRAGSCPPACRRHPPRNRSRSTSSPSARNSVGGPDAGDPANGVLRARSSRLTEKVTDADILAAPRPGVRLRPQADQSEAHRRGDPGVRNTAVAHVPLRRQGGRSARRLSELTRLKHLRVLELTDLNADDAWLAALKPLTELRRLSLDGCYQVTDAGLAHLAGMTHLRELLLHGTRGDGQRTGRLANAKGLTRVELPQQTDAAIQAAGRDRQAPRGWRRPSPRSSTGRRPPTT